MATYLFLFCSAIILSITVLSGLFVAFGISDFSHFVILASIAGTFGGVGFIAVSFAKRLKELLQSILDFERGIEALITCEKDKCLDMVDWINDPTMAAYRNSVIEQGRQFTIGEYHAMKQWMESREARDKEQRVEDA